MRGEKTKTISLPNSLVYNHIIPNSYVFIMRKLWKFSDNFKWHKLIIHQVKFQT